MNTRNDIAIELKNISRCFSSGTEKITVLKEVSLSIQRGEMVAIIGASGSGKSTLMNIVGCLDKPTSGEMKLGDVATPSATPEQLAQLRSQHVGFIFQRYHLIPYLTAAENVAMPALYTDMSVAERNQRARSLLARLGLEERLHHKPAQLSGGQQQRVSIARALMNDADIILADEPTGALDSTNGKALMDILHSLHQDGRTIIIVTHDRAIANQAQRIIEISDGSVINSPSERHAVRTPITSALPITQSIARPKAWHNLGETIRGALHSLLGHRLRTFLSMLGIIIGISSVVSSIALGKGAQKDILQQISQLGSSTLEIRPGLGWDNPRPDFENSLTLADVKLLARQPYVDSLSPVVSKVTEISRNGKQVPVQLSGVSNSYFRVQGMHFSAGSNFTRQDIAARESLVIIDAETRRTLFARQENPVGQIIQLSGVPFRVAGVASQNTASWSGGNLSAWMPYTSLIERLSGEITIESILVRAGERESLKQIQGSIERLLIQSHGQKDFFTLTNDQMTKTIQDASDSMARFIAAIAGISLLVGGVGVMNIMLVSVIERTHEIGIRLSVGARPADIMRQFLIEAVVICLIGGMLGIGLSLIIGLIVNGLSDSITLLFTWQPLVLACGTSAIIGLCFGFFPARSASALQPTEALARE
ncbi:ABC transporter permease [Buttiauxella selenatireducens]|uniref:Pyoverdine export ATP-binding/permease protein PvdT n=1 Tax=Buttiauxella selenatireducens TaxID=3073902 RepID=A0ABY9SA37_9ENTR|nr:ABC transporter permease [Buttiauxella sp. R73]WMY72952.1 ABC transporter permease [Buttiauxella sp. R73]